MGEGYGFDPSKKSSRRVSESAGESATPSMNNHTLRSFALLTLAASAAAPLALGCSGAEGEHAGSTDDAIIITKSVAIAKPSFDAAMAFVGVSQANAEVNANHGVVTPSAVMTNYLGIKPASFDFAPTHMTPSWPAPDGTLYADHVLVNNMSVTLDGSSVLASLTVSADLSYDADSSFSPSFKVHVDPSTVVVRFALDGSGGLSVSDASADMHYYAHDCGFAGWCSSIANGGLPGMSGIVVNMAKTFLAGQKPAIDGAWNTLLSAWGNGGLLVPKRQWTRKVVPSSETISGSVLSFQTQMHAPPPSPACKLYWDCTTSYSYVSCSNWSGDMVTYRQTTGGPFVTLSQSTSLASWQLTDNYQVCASDADGTTCGAVFNEPKSSFPATGLCPKPPPPPPPPALCHWVDGQLVCVTGGDGGGSLGGGGVR